MSKRIPINAAERIAKDYGYDQIIIYARKIDTPEKQGMEHITTYGVTKKHCNIAKLIGDNLKKLAGWGSDPISKANG